MRKKILLVEDDTNLGFVIKDNLEVAGYDVSLCQNGEMGWHAFEKIKYDICVLDVMLPKMDGFTLAKQIRIQDQQVPILFLTAKAMKEDRINGFTLGGDDYITKPFSIEELLLRIEVFLKRSQNPLVETRDQATIGIYNFNFANLSLSVNNKVKKLTMREAELLKLLCEQKGKVIPREEILNKIWGDDDYFLGRSLDVFISKLRKYLKDDPKVAITNYHGVGFKLDA